jgi:curved DNA-binding protein
MPTNKDPYEILGIGRNATPDEIKRAYRRLAKEHHPDRNPGDKSAEQRFKELHAAYEVLADPQRRTQYDRFGAGGPAPDVHNWASDTGVHFEDVGMDFGSIGDLTSVFEQFFTRGGGRPRRRTATRAAPPRGADLEHTVELSFEEAARGTEREVVLTAGPRADDQERIRFRVPPGVHDGQRVRVRGKGQAGPGGRGDLMIRCVVQPHPIFQRDGRELLLDLPLTFAEATLGARVEIPTLGGTTVLKVPPGTSSGTKLRLRGHGVTDPQGQTGDLYAIVRIVAPKELSTRARDLLEQLNKELDQHPRTGPAWPQ